LATLEGRRLPRSKWPLGRARQGDSFQGLLVRLAGAQGAFERVLSFGGTALSDPGGKGNIAILTVRDVTERKRRQDDLTRLVAERTHELDGVNHTFKVLAECNQAIIRATSEPELLQAFCSISQSLEGIRRAWIDATGTQEAATGKELVLPLRFGRQSYGFLHLETEVRERFEGKGRQLLLDLAGNLTLGIHSWRAREQRDLALRTAEMRSEQLRHLALELARAEQRERRRLAQVLHDDLQQLLVGATFSVESLQGMHPEPEARHTLDQLAGILGDALKVSRRTTAELCPTAFSNPRVAAGLDWLAGQAREKHGLGVTLEVDGDITVESDPLRVFLLESVRELLLNVAKHAHAQRAGVRVRARTDGTLEVAVEDPGAGFPPEALDLQATPQGFGLFSIRERLQFLHGRMMIESDPQRGSRITLELPGAARPRGT
jgi:signal transduction histidine kinase